MHRRSDRRQQHLPAHRPRSGGRSRRSQSRDRSRRDERRDDRRSGRDTGHDRDRAERRQRRPDQAASSSSAPPSAASSCSNRMEFHQTNRETRISSLDSGNAPECIITHRLTIGASEHGTSLLPAPSTSQSVSLSASQSASSSSSSSQSHIPDKRQAQEEKRKLLWAADPVPGKASVWQGLRFSDSNQTTKFRKLMGMKKEESGAAAAGDGDGLQQRQEQLFRDLDKQYSAARSVTHTQRGTGLGFGS